MKSKKESQKTTKKPKLKLIDGRGYTIRNIKEVLDEETSTKFEDWISGQTVGIYEGESLIYQYDFIRFLKGLPVLD